MGFVFATFVSLLMSGILYQIQMDNNKYDRITEKDQYDYNGTTKSYSRINSYGTQFALRGAVDGKEFTDNPKESKELVETVILRTCRMLTVVAKINECDNQNSEADIWSFMGIPGTVGSMELAWGTGAVSNVFSCATMGSGEYGRAQLRKALPPAYIFDENGDTSFGYNMTGMIGSYDRMTDPCGYTGMITSN